jgi:hypothetical protein
VGARIDDPTSTDPPQLDSCMVYFNNLAKFTANLYPGLPFQFTMGLIGLSLLCNLIVPCICGAFEFITVYSYFHLSCCLIAILHVLIPVLMSFCRMLV